MEIHYTRQMVLSKLRKCFPDTARAADALALLDTYGPQEWHRETERVQLAILKLSAGRLDLLRAHVNTAGQDYRDVLAWAEFPSEFATAPGQTPAADLAQARRRDREQWERWLADP